MKYVNIRHNISTPASIHPWMTLLQRSFILSDMHVDPEYRHLSEEHSTHVAFLMYIQLISLEIHIGIFVQKA